jgi:predicted PurR-regulated permease PerM
MSRSSTVSTLTIQRMLLPILIGTLIYFSFEVLKVFLTPVAWAAVLVYVTWPLYQWSLSKLAGREHAAAGLVTIGLVIVVGVPIGFGLIVLEHQIVYWYHQLHNQLNAGQLLLPASLQKLPWIGGYLQELVAQLNDDPRALEAQLRGVLHQQVGKGARLIGNVAEHFASLVFCLLTMFFFYKDGARIIVHIKLALARIIGKQGDHYLTAIAATTRAVVYGNVLTAVAQGILAFIGYSLAGLPGAFVFATITAVLAMIPFASPLAWGLAVAWIALTGFPLEATCLAVWAGIVIFTIDNIFRPIVISSATEIPFLVVLFGVLGGLTAFGMIGLFIGPVILAMLLAVWREWLTYDPDQDEVLIKIIDPKTPPSQA